MMVKSWLLGLGAILLSLQVQADGLIDLGEAVKVYPAGKSRVNEVQLQLYSDKFGEQLQLVAQRPIGGSKTLSLPIKDAEKLHQALQKAQRWSDTAREHKTAMIKPLACIGEDPTGACAQTGATVDINQLGMLFNAEEGGTPSVLIMSFRSGPARTRSAFFLDDKGLAQLTQQIATWQDGLERLRVQQAKEALFN
ncbi:hypothetical protein Misp06_00829 [Microbulbifer sp. NBRC 101763]|uniref:hypothetical protein n=1 Tax=Microbulbifer sp. NBRC 101763 TaxID=1113820 RepID=UPI0030B04AA2